MHAITCLNIQRVDTFFSIIYQVTTCFQIIALFINMLQATASNSREINTKLKIVGDILKKIYVYKYLQPWYSSYSLKRIWFH